ncbi:MAG: hypothetical protein N4A49_06025 [Marinifilaceae bacterium]|jgi:hypothetical protein|nr:hypothetical protein [Marinifilaceae bacterium]
MKIFISILFCLSACLVDAQNTKVEVIREFVNEIKSFEKINFDLDLPIRTFNQKAKEKADTVIVVDKSNIKESLVLAKKYNLAFITVENHTIVRISNFNKTSISGSWSTRMPFGEGYIQRHGRLNATKGTINNIIGRPDKKIRNLYLFKMKTDS